MVEDSTLRSKLPSPAMGAFEVVSSDVETFGIEQIAAVAPVSTSRAASGFSPFRVVLAASTPEGLTTKIRTGSLYTADRTAEHCADRHGTTEILVK